MRNKLDSGDSDYDNEMKRYQDPRIQVPTRSANGRLITQNA